MTEHKGVERSRTELTATERLRAMLDERGIEYTCNDRDEDIYNDRQLETSWSDGRFNYHLVEFFNGESPVTTQFSMGCKYGMTAEQAIAATVGDKPKADITRLHATVNAAITGIVRNARCFSDYGTATEHINDNGDVTAIHECVKRAAMVGAGTCKNVSTTGNFRCSECDATDLDFDKPTYCHGCGRKVVDE